MMKWKWDLMKVTAFIVGLFALGSAAASAAEDNAGIDKAVVISTHQPAAAVAPVYVNGQLNAIKLAAVNVQFGQFHGSAPNGTPIMRTSPAVTFDPGWARTAMPTTLVILIPTAQHDNAAAATPALDLSDGYHLKPA